MIQCYNDFLSTLLSAGFSLASGNSDGIYAVIPWTWNEEPPYETPVQWFCDDPNLSPWYWRMRVLEERNDIAYAKLFFKKSGYITRDWYPYFLAARRAGDTFAETYESGLISHAAKRIYEVVEAKGVLPSHDIKQLAGFGKTEKSVFDRGITELQMGMFVTACGRQVRISKAGNEHGMDSNVFCTTESFWGNDVFSQAEEISQDEAFEKIRTRVLELNPQAEEKKIRKFVFG